MSVIAGLAKSAGTRVLTGTRPTRKPLPGTKRRLVVMAAALGALVAFAALMAASQAPNAKYSSAASTDSQTGTEAALLSEPAAPQISDEEAIDAYGKLPLSFIPNEGQTDEAVRYYAQGAGYGLFFTKGGAMLSFTNGEERGQALALDFLGSDPGATLTARQRFAGKVNYLVGNDPAKWRQGLPTHAELLYGGLWPGIDMAVRGEGDKLKYEFHLKPGSALDDVRLGYRGAEGLKVGAGGELLVQTSLGILKDAAPVSYQLIRGERVPVESRYELKGDGGYGFALGAYDPRYPLVIDPGLDYSTFIGGNGVDRGEGIAVDGEGRAYVTGYTESADFPTTPGAFDTTHNGGVRDAFVTKFNARGSAIAYSTLLGGTNDDRGHGIAVDGMGNAYVTGGTGSLEFPTTTGAFDATHNAGVEAFVTKLNASGSALIFSTYLGGTEFDQGMGIAVREGRAYVTGETASFDSSSSDFPTTPGAFDTSFNGGDINGGDVFVTKLNAAGSALAYSTFLGGTKVDQGWGIAVDGEGRAHVTGQTASFDSSSSDFPTTPGAFDTSFNGVRDAFVTKLNSSGSALIFSTFLGGTNGAGGLGIAVREGRAYVTGETSSTDFPTTPGAFDTSFNGNGDVFVTKLNAAGSRLAYSTFLGGTNQDFGSALAGMGIAVDGEGRAYVTGSTNSADFPTTPGAFDTSYNGIEDAFVTKLPTG
jgi:hypothetical protein